ncbi:MAG TPA: hypothetical protein VJ718_06745 [Candidatus Binataceae bacterium]|nr:hypothetical protein [Candidatus Binataceae bacterium]
MNERVTRNQVVFILGTPERTEGSLNSPVECEERGIRYNEQWIYRNSRTDPADAPERVVYWHRYDFKGTLIRDGEGGEWRPDTALAEAARSERDRLPPLSDGYQAIAPNRRYRPASEVKDQGDLGGYTQPESEIRPRSDPKPME